MSSLALASGPERDPNGKGLIDGLADWTRDTLSDLWQTRRFGTLNVVSNVVEHGWKKGLERQAEQMNEAKGALLRTGVRTAAIGSIIATKGAAAKPVAVLSHVVKGQTGFEALPDVIGDVTALGTQKGGKAAVADLVDKLDVASWRDSQQQTPAPKPAMAATPV
ncbi:MAG: hypothetical protein AAF213_02440 [Pseudomonadota bacterium]